jgi:hypothetical protein
MRSTKGKCAGHRDGKQGVVEVLSISSTLAFFFQKSKRTCLTKLISIACLNGTLRPNVFR